MKVTNRRVDRSNYSMRLEVEKCLNSQFPNWGFSLNVYRRVWMNPDEFERDDFFDISLYEDELKSPIIKCYKFKVFCSIECAYFGTFRYESEGNAVIDFIENQLSDDTGYSIHTVGDIEWVKKTCSLIAKVEMDYAL